MTVVSLETAKMLGLPDPPGMLVTADDDTISQFIRRKRARRLSRSELRKGELEA